MRSAMAFLPSRMTVFTNFVTRRRVSIAWSVNFGSGSGFRFGTSPLRGIASLASRPSDYLLISCLVGPRLLRALGAVLRAALPAVVDARGVERAADDVVTNAREVLDAAPGDHHHRELLQVVPLAR